MPASRVVGVLVCAVGLARAPAPALADVFFGDTHAHSGLSNDATGSPDTFFTVARDLAGLDFVVLSDHDVFLTPSEVEVLKTTAASFDQEGTFVAFSGVEWTQGWHMNAYFQHDDEHYCLVATDGLGCVFPDGFYASYGPLVLAGEAAAQVNHPNSVYRVNWGTIDDTITTNVEIWNSGGNGDQEVGFNNALFALRTGFRLGLVGVSDDHHTDVAPPLLGTGLTGCRVDSLTRADLLAALRERRCYGTDGDRIQLDFSVDGTFMGGEVDRPVGSSVTATVEVVGTDVPAAIEIVRDGDVVATEMDCTGIACTFAAPVDVTDLRGFLYARVRQVNGKRAWSSPVWVTGTCPDDADCLRRRALGGGATRRTECAVEWVVPSAPKTRVPNRLTCTDGDPSCDFGSTPGECTFRVGLCLAVADPRVPCTPVVPDSVDVVEPPEPPFAVSNFVDPDFQNRRSLLAALRALSSEPPGACTPLFQLHVPLATSATRAATGRRRLEIVAHTSAGDDVDRFTLRCRHAAS